MDFTGKIKNVNMENEQINITISTNNQTILENIEKLYKFNKELNITIKAKSQKRSLDSNSYAWQLMGDLAKIMEISKDEVYLQMLERYGVSTFIVVKPSIVDRVSQEWKLVRNLGEVKINGKIGVQLECFFGSSTYTQSEMCHFIDGIVNECRDLGIPTLEDEEINNLNEGWNI